LTCGILLLDKPPGLSSSGATQRVRRLLGVDKAGHVGSLDPLATGMLPICLGDATKVAGEVLEGAKTYRFRIVLGARTATGDIEGDVVESSPVPAVDPERRAEVFRGFLGESSQIPPMYSAIKQGGQPLYRLARAGLTVERPARTIRIDRLDIEKWGSDWLDCRVVCGKGTYVRVLAEDIAVALGTCGHVGWLRRESVDPFPPGSMVDLAEVEACARSGRIPALFPADAAVSHLPAVRVQGDAERRLALGQELDGGAEVAFATPVPAPGSTVRLHSGDGRFLGLGLMTGDSVVRAKRLFKPMTQDASTE
jgi:tRNA pseudouridine55 synthase